MNQERSKKYQAPVALFNDPRRFFIEWVANGSRVLDVGCACGDFGVALAEAVSVELVGLEYDAGSVDLAAATGAYLQVLRVDLECASLEARLGELGLFDVIVFGDVLEHLRDPAAVLIRLGRLLRPGGWVLISLPNIAHASVKLNLLEDRFDYADRGIMDRTHLRFFTWRSIAHLLDSVGLHIHEVRPTMTSKHRVTASSRFRRLPSAVGQVIVENPHSFVNQYVCKCSGVPASGSGGNADRLCRAWSGDVGSVPIHPVVRVIAGCIPWRASRRRVRERLHLWMNRREDGLEL